MNIVVLAILIYFVMGMGMAIWDFRSKSALHEPPKFIGDRSISTAIIFILIWPYKLLKKV